MSSSEKVFDTAITLGLYPDKERSLILFLIFSFISIKLLCV